MPDNAVEGALFYMDNVNFYGNWTTARPLRFSKDHPLVSKNSGVAAVVNPESARRDLAFDYIRLYFSDSASAEDRILFDAYSDPNAMTDDADYADWIVQMRRQTGDLTVVPSVTQENPDAWTQVDEAARAYAEGEIPHAALTGILNGNLA